MKKLLTILLLLLACMALFCACSDDESPNGEPSHTHTLTRHAAVSATCTAKGNIEYWTCADCGKYFSDADGANEIADNDTAIPVSGHAWSGNAVCETCGYQSKLVYTEYDSYVEVTGIGTASGDIIIAELYNGKPVTGIRYDTFKGCAGLTGITIPSSVTYIEDCVFEGCTELISVRFEKSSQLTTIGLRAFSNCISLTSIKIPSSVTSIGNNAFEGCAGVVQKENGVSYVDKWAVDCDPSTTQAVLRSDTVGLASYAFEYCADLDSVQIPLSVMHINPGAFLYCRKLSSVTIPTSVTSIGYSAFSGCASLTNITIPTSVTSIASDTFYGCTNLRSVTIPSSVTSIGDRAFWNCTSLAMITIPSSVTSIGTWAFYGCTNLTNATFKNISGWWVATSSTATSGTSVSENDLYNILTAATYLKSTYYNYYWKRG